ncbi:mitochondrial inner membrane peptidase complex catalytic subunit, partial [Syncephalis pseudoplumigaleata]
YPLAQCTGPSMLPTLNNDGDIIAIEKMSIRHMQSNASSAVAPRGLGLGDMVISISPLDPHRHVCKRVLGLPGDSICIDPTKDPARFVTVPRGHVWLQGDNMENSTDSRQYGPVPIAMLRGRVIARVWPDPCWMTNGLRVINDHS